MPLIYKNTCIISYRWAAAAEELPCHIDGHVAELGRKGLVEEGVDEGVGAGGGHPQQVAAEVGQHHTFCIKM